MHRLSVRMLVLVLVLAAAAMQTACGETASPAADRGPDPTLASLPRGGAAISGSRIDPLFGDAADAITQGRFSYEVRCWTPIDWRGVMAYWAEELGTLEPAGFIVGQSDMQLSPDVCASLTRFAYGPGRHRRTLPDLETTIAIVVFTHEIGHSVVGASEAATECWAVQHADTVATALGARPKTASMIARAYFEDVYPTLAPEYRSDECRPGGAFDEEPESPAWP